MLAARTTRRTYRHYRLRHGAIVLRLCRQLTAEGLWFRYARRWASLLLWLSGTITPVSPVAVAFNGKAFLSSESGASALDARTNPMIVGPRPVTAGFAELGCNLLVQTSRGHILTGSGAK